MESQTSKLSELSVLPENSTSQDQVTDLKKNLLSTPPLKTRRIGISSSEASDLALLGMREFHHKDIFIELNRYLLANGASLVYGGDLRTNGLTETLMELVRLYRFEGVPFKERLLSYLSYPIYLSLDEAKETKYNSRILFNKIEPASDVPTDPSVFSPSQGISSRYAWGRCLTRMREEREAACDAHIFLGGPDKEYKGRAPGLIEEFLIAIKKKKPIFLLGGWGGITRKLAAHFNGANTLPELLHQLTAPEGFQQLKEYYQQKGQAEQMNWPEELPGYCNEGWAALNNGLSSEENEVLASSTEVYEVIYYVLKGLIKP